MKFSNPLIAVADLDRSKAFYIHCIAPYKINDMTF